jgi:hypothetical protein
LKRLEQLLELLQRVGDILLHSIAVGFYKALAANRSIEDAYKFGCVEVRLHGIPEHLTPIAYKLAQGE